MNLRKLISLNTNYTRSVNLERDSDSKAIVSSYIPTSRTTSTLKHIAETFGSQNIPRSWALIGPYGSGKSSFAVFMSHLFGNPKQKATQKAYGILSDSSSDLSQQFKFELGKSKGYAHILLTGSPEPLAKRFVWAMHECAHQFWKGKGRKPNIVKDIEREVEKSKHSNSDIIWLIKKLQSAIAKSKGQGLLIVIDELGKFLEYEARHYNANDIYLLQSLAEHAYEGHEANILLFVLMHQGFEQYARGLSEELRNEWGKIQGRFESIPFLETAEQTLRIVSRAIQHKIPSPEYENLKTSCCKLVQVLAKQKALPGLLNEQEATDLFVSCYPLHPLASLILPVLCQKVAQNERTLFSYLGSKEIHGFTDSLNHLKLGKWVSLADIYDYFIANQPGVVNDPNTHRRWAEVVTALDRLGDAPAEEEQLLKIIGLLNIIGARDGLKASKEVLNIALDNKTKASKALSQLKKKSIIHYRKFSGEYRVWQGSDFDLDSAVKDEIEQLGCYDLPESLNTRKPLPPLVVTRYTIKSGTLRYFQPVFVNKNSYSTVATKSKNLRLILYLAGSYSDFEEIQKKTVSDFSKLDVVAICPSTSQLKETVAEVMALHRVQRNRHELQSDPIAMREFRDRLAAAENLEDELISSLLESPQQNTWFWNGKDLFIDSKRNLQKKLSGILKKLFKKAPIFKNELINRNKPSTQAVAARNKLLSALVNSSSQKNLGIEKFPAEKGIYLALLRETGLHRQINDKWQLAPPEPNNECNVRPIWDEIEKFLAETENTPRSLTDLESVLMSPPYGVKAGILPILFVITLLYYQHELALYEEGVYIPFVTDRHIERFSRRPDVFSIQRFRISGIRSSVFKKYSKAIYGDANRENSLISIAKPLAQFMANLNEYTKQTSALSNKAKQLLKTFTLAKSPQKLLFEGLPQACGYPVIVANKTKEKQLEGFTETLRETLRELNNAYPKLMEEQKTLISSALLNAEYKDIEKLRSDLRGRFSGLANYTIDKQGLLPFLKFISDENSDEETWFQNLLLFLGEKPASKWTDLERDKVELRLMEFSRRLNDLEKLRVNQDSKKLKTDQEFEVILLRTVRQGRGEVDKLVSIDSKTKKHIQKAKKSFQKLLTEVGDQETRLALLASLVDDFLEEFGKKETQQHTSLLKKDYVNE